MCVLIAQISVNIFDINHNIIPQIMFAEEYEFLVFRINTQIYVLYFVLFSTKFSENGCNYNRNFNTTLGAKKQIQLYCRT